MAVDYPVFTIEKIFCGKGKIYSPIEPDKTLLGKHVISGGYLVTIPHKNKKDEKITYYVTAFIGKYNRKTQSYSHGILYGNNLFYSIITQKESDIAESNLENKPLKIYTVRPTVKGDQYYFEKGTIMLADAISKKFLNENGNISSTTMYDLLDRHLKEKLGLKLAEGIASAEKEKRRSLFANVADAIEKIADAADDVVDQAHAEVDKNVHQATRLVQSAAKQTDKQVNELKKEVGRTVIEAGEAVAGPSNGAELAPPPIPEDYPPDEEYQLSSEVEVVPPDQVASVYGKPFEWLGSLFSAVGDFFTAPFRRASSSDLATGDELKGLEKASSRRASAPNAADVNEEEEL